MFEEVLRGFIEDNGVEAVFEELFPGREAAEIFYEMYESGMIPEDMMEKFLEDE